MEDKVNHVLPIDNKFISLCEIVYRIVFYCYFSRHYHWPVHTSRDPQSTTLTEERGNGHPTSSLF